MSDGAKRSAEAVCIQVEDWVRRWPARVGFLTLTYAGAAHTDDRQRVQAAWALLLASGRWDRVFGPGIMIWERHRSGGLHWHGAVVCHGDISTGTDVKLLRGTRGRLGANVELRRVWREMRGWGRWGIGRNRLEPVMEPGGFGRYVAKYITGEQWLGREERDRGARRVRWVRCRAVGVRTVSCNFGRVGRRVAWFRECVGALVAAAGEWGRAFGLSGEQFLRAVWGPHWVWGLRRVAETERLKHESKCGGEQQWARALAWRELAGRAGVLRAGGFATRAATCLRSVSGGGSEVAVGGGVGVVASGVFPRASLRRGAFVQSTLSWLRSLSEEESVTGRACLPEGDRE